MLPSQYLEKGWCQVFSARNKRGKAEAPESCKAVSYCIVGAFFASVASGTMSFVESQALKTEIHRRVLNMGFETSIDYNDFSKRTQQEVVELVKQSEITVGLNSE